MAYLNRSQLSQMSEHTRVLQLIAQQICRDGKSDITPKEEGTLVSDTAAIPCEDLQVEIPRQMEYQGDSSLIRKRYPRYRQRRCEGWCGCRCHLPSRVQSPQKFALVAGNLLISFSGFRIWTRKCNDRACNRQSIPTIKVMYQFPTWLLQRMLYFAASMSEMNGPELTLSMPRTVSPNAAIFSYAVQGNMKKIQELFTRGVASPYDVALNNGRTVLHVSLWALTNI